MLFIKRLIDKLFSTPVPTVQVGAYDQPTEVVRLREDVYNRIRAEVSNPIVSSSTTELEAGYKLGVEFVLQHLRKNYTV